MRATAAVVLLFAALSASALDRLELSNGDIITGTIVRLDETTVVIDTSYGVLEVARDQVARGVFGLEAVTPAADVSEPSADRVTPSSETPVEVETDEVESDVAASTELPSLRDGLMLHLPFDGSFSDAAGRYVPTNNGMRFATGADGVASSAARSDGSGTYVSVATDDALDTMNQFTVAFWVRSDDAVPTQYLVSKWSRASGDRAEGKFTLQSSRRGLTLFVVDAGGRYHWLSAPGAVIDGQWQHVAATIANGRAVLYVDGVQAASRRFDFQRLFVDDSPLLIMTAEATNPDTYGFYNASGAIDDLRLYDRALSSTEVAALARVE